MPPARATGESGAPELVTQAAADANLWHRRLGKLNPCSDLAEVVLAVFFWENENYGGIHPSRPTLPGKRSMLAFHKDTDIQNLHNVFCEALIHPIPSRLLVQVWHNLNMHKALLLCVRSTADVKYA